MQDAASLIRKGIRESNEGILLCKGYIYDLAGSYLRCKGYLNCDNAGTHVEIPMQIPGLF